VIILKNHVLTKKEASMTGISLGWLIAAVVVVGSSVWVYKDVNKIGVYIKGVGPVGWLLGCLFLWIFMFPYYLISRGAALAKSANDPARHKWPVGK